MTSALSKIPLFCKKCRRLIKKRTSNNQSYCKDCRREVTNQQSKNYRIKHLDRYNTSKRRYYKRNKEELLTYKKRWLAETPKGRALRDKQCHRPNTPERREKLNKWRKANPDKVWEYEHKYPLKNEARRIARKMIPIPKGQKCQDCKVALASERHHEDYSKPLKVIFLCCKCHKIRNRRKNK